MVKLIMGVVDLGQAHERELIHVIVDLSCFLTCMLGGVRFYYYLGYMHVSRDSWYYGTLKKWNYTAARVT